MHAAVVESFDRPPRFAEFADPVAAGADEVVVDVLATGLHPLVRGRAAGTHYSAGTTLPLVPGIDGVGRDADGGLWWFLLADDVVAGSMAQRAVIDRRRSVALPPDADPVVVAAGMNPGMSSWVALQRRMHFEPGMSVLVHGATGNAGRLAVQVARRLGADRVIGAGRDEARLAVLPALGASQTVRLGDDAAQRLADAAAEVDVVLDYLWGAPTAAAITAMVTARTDRARPLTWIEVGAIAGREAAVPGAALRSSALTLVGSGLGSVSRAAMVDSLGGLAAELAAGAFDVATRPVPLSDVSATWTGPSDAGERIVFLPQAGDRVGRAG